MKTPRVSDFDPRAVPELGSPLDGMPSIQPPAKDPVPPNRSPLGGQTPQDGRTQAQSAAIPQASETAPERTSAPPPVRPYGSTPARRVITRYSFEFFQDQIDALRSFSLEEKLRSEKGSMSEMVREALDTYLAKRYRADG